jgi:hypothetical protein
MAFLMAFMTAMPMFTLGSPVHFPLRGPVAWPERGAQNVVWNTSGMSALEGGLYSWWMI